MTTQQILTVGALLFAFTKLMKFGLRISGVPVVIFVVGCSILICGGYLIEKAVFTMDAIVEFLSNTANISLAALGIDNLSTFQDKARVLDELKDRLSNLQGQLESAITAKPATRKRYVKPETGEVSDVKEPGMETINVPIPAEELIDPNRTIQMQGRPDMEGPIDGTVNPYSPKNIPSNP